MRVSAHRVRETLTTRFAKCLCSILLSLILVVGIILFILWISLRPHRPRFHLAAFAIPGIAHPAGLAGSAISFRVTDRNPNQDIGIYYGVISGSVFYKNRLIASGSQVMSPFYQPPKNTTVIAGKVAGARIKAGSALATQLPGIAAGGRVELRFELRSTIRFKVKVWDTHQHNLHVECLVAVGSDGNILPESKDIKCSIYF
ncbi:NDR1/HIN1-Like protein 3-like [Canna indica]|uniref:NDR1/HIN1-Like protein 3-like n=1 Tax=Canna indica TaxID=4628 RepID=A0AAQ3JMY1_9LILI|nr:NDR1/HIN1-Like protein 3-like [Canna indica]